MERKYAVSMNNWYGHEKQNNLLRHYFTHKVSHGQEEDKVRARGIELVKEHSYTNRVRYLLKELGL